MQLAEFMSPLSTVFLLQSYHRAPLPPLSAPALHRLPNSLRRHFSPVLRAPPKREAAWMFHNFLSSITRRKRTRRIRFENLPQCLVERQVGGIGREGQVEWFNKSVGALTLMHLPHVCMKKP